MKTAIVTLLVGITIGVMVLCAIEWQIAHRAPALVQYESNEFHYRGYYTTSGGQTYTTNLRFTDYTFANNELRGHESESESAFEISTILNRIGGDGWHLVWSDGERYIVERPIGKWKHAGFRVSQEPQTGGETK